MGRTCSTYGIILKCILSVSGKTRPLGWPRCRWEDNIKTDLREVGCDAGDWLYLAQDMDQWLAYLRAVITSGFLKSQLAIYLVCFYVFKCVCVHSAHE